MQLRAKRLGDVDTTVGDLLAALYEAASEMTNDPVERNQLVRVALRDFPRPRQRMTRYTPRAA